MNIERASLADLAIELERADVALSLGFSRKEERRWRAYRKAVWTEIKRRTPVPTESRKLTDADLLRELSAD